MASSSCSSTCIVAVCCLSLIAEIQEIDLQALFSSNDFWLFIFSSWNELRADTYEHWYCTPFIRYLNIPIYPFEVICVSWYKVCPGSNRNVGHVFYIIAAMIIWISTLVPIDAHSDWRVLNPWKSSFYLWVLNTIKIG